jgi:hypothetical protein
MALVRLAALARTLGLATVFARRTRGEAARRRTGEHHGRRAAAAIIGHESGRSRAGVIVRPVLGCRAADGRRVRTAVAAAHDPAAPDRALTVVELDRIGWRMALPPGGGRAALVAGVVVLRPRIHLRALRAAGGRRRLPPKNRAPAAAPLAAMSAQATAGVNRPPRQFGISRSSASTTICTA